MAYILYTLNVPIEDNMPRVVISYIIIYYMY